MRAVATYALTLHDPNSMAASTLLLHLERKAQSKGAFDSVGQRDVTRPRPADVK